MQEPANLDLRFRRLSRSLQPSPKDWADSYLAAFALSAELTLVTFDRALHRRVERSLLLSVQSMEALDVIRLSIVANRYSTECESQSERLAAKRW